VCSASVRAWSDRAQERSVPLPYVVGRQVGRECRDQRPRPPSQSHGSWGLLRRQLVALGHLARHTLHDDVTSGVLRECSDTEFGDKLGEHGLCFGPEPRWPEIKPILCHSPCTINRQNSAAQPFPSFKELEPGASLMEATGNYQSCETASNDQWARTHGQTLSASS
jgi:hypothetical protein